MNQIRAWLRIFLFVTTISIGIFLCIVSALFGGRYLDRNMKIRLQWIRVITKCLGLKIEKLGTVPDGVFLFTSNHRSFIDPMVALHYISAFPLAKAEVNGYPLVGFGARMTGVLFVQRHDLQSRRDARTSIEKTWEKGYSVLVYPEGTTHNTPTPGPFRRGSFEVAAELDIPVVPIAIEFQDPSDHWTERTLLQQYFYQFGKAGSRCRIVFGSPLTGYEGDELSQKSKTWIDATVAESRKAFDEREDNVVSL
ncbi:MAG: 1-acyl-sn-glycerol-3-phosphate acyltransferase [Saprospiraceae bacterium]|nr:1-acyl-sn-glycerol-3-phosphate acyltransferase [Saprospiraceae bacterium]